MIEQGATENLKRLKDTFRYQDDLIVFDDFNLLQNVIEDIYPKEMIVNNTNISARKCCYLDLNISIDQYLGDLESSVKNLRRAFLNVEGFDRVLRTHKKNCSIANRWAKLSRAI